MVPLTVLQILLDSRRSHMTTHSWYQHLHKGRLAVYASCHLLVVFLLVISSFLLYIFCFKNWYRTRYLNQQCVKNHQHNSQSRRQEIDKSDCYHDHDCTLMTHCHFYVLPWCSWQGTFDLLAWLGMTIPRGIAAISLSCQSILLSWSIQCTKMFIMIAFHYVGLFWHFQLRLIHWW